MKYHVTYKGPDYDASERREGCKTWKQACAFMKSLLDDGYLILGVDG